MSWQEQLQDIFKTLPELLSYLELPLDHPEVLTKHNFPLKVPRSFAARMKKGDFNCPLLRQVLPVTAELTSNDGLLDPLMEQSFIENPGLLQKFQQRVLILASGHCAVHCRYCFRRHFPYHEQRFSKKDWIALYERLKEDRSIKEVILSGGDPLTLPDEYLIEIFSHLNSIEHLESIRIHTRLPIVIPSRLTTLLKETISQSRIPIVTVLHINHPNELDDELAYKLKEWQKSGCLLFNQAVLLKNINDSTPVQEALWRRCFQAGVLAYYLHQFDDVKNAQHFFVPKEQGIIIMNELRKLLPGFMMPLYVQEIPYAGSKVPLYQ
jgi:EF-P beta-lysylation protein EpmB